jgi:tetratricopeptide (TPR) repeat protein
MNLRTPENPHQDLEGQLLQQIDDRNLSCSERAWLRCEFARKLEEAGNYEAAHDALGEIWQSVSERPLIEGLDQAAAGEVLLRAGVLIGWIGSARQISDAQERAKDLISESIRIFETLEDQVKVAEAMTDLACCYWRGGAFDDARMILRNALARLGDKDEYRKAVALIRSAIVEKEATRYNDALRFLREATPLIEKSVNHALKGKFHNELATVYENLSRAERRDDYRDRAFVEYAAASFHLEQAGHIRYHACVENNLGFLFFTVGTFTEAHEHLNRARRLLARIKDSVHIAQVDETRARVLLADGRNAEAELVVRGAVRTLEKGGQLHLLAEALTTHGSALARTGRHRLSRSTLERAVEVAEQAGDFEAAGQAAITLIEEIGDRLTAIEMGNTYERAAALLANSQHPGILARLSASARQIFSIITPQLASLPEQNRAETFRPPSNWHEFHFWTETERYEKYLIARALKDANRVVTRAAKLLGFPHHQSLIAMLNGHHKDLLTARTPAMPRPRKKRRSQSLRGPRNAPGGDSARD